MRLSTDADRDEERAFETIAAAAEAGITVFDTARAYGDNEDLLARALRRAGADATARIVTKGGMSRAGGGWIPDGRAKAIRPTAKPAWPPWTACRSTSTSSIRPIRGRRGQPRYAR